MRRGKEIEAVEAANPVDRAEVGQLSLDRARSDLFDEIVAEPQERPRSGEAGAFGRARRRFAPGHSRLAYLALAGTATVACALVLVLTGIGVGPTRAPAPAVGAVLTRLASVSPHILLDLPRWEMQSVNQIRGEEGRIQFAADDLSVRSFLAGRYVVTTQSVASLGWRAKGANSPIGPTRGDRFLATAPVLGATARVYTHEVLAGGKRGFTAVWGHGGLRLRLVSAAPDLAAFARFLAALRFADREAWLSAVPSDIEVIDSHPVAGIPLSEKLTALRCKYPLPPALVAREDRAMVVFFNRQCHGAAH